ncbi:MAG TPA: hypothetical protein VE842_09945 [Pyrinomonadaceae bacterium]|nr:hypothetical protein [Pyrinomonadaceae bacterium]
MIKENLLSRRARLATLLQMCAVIALLAGTIEAQQKNKKDTAAPPAAPRLTRTTTRHESRRFGYGSALTILGAPAGSITIEAWPRSEVDITADIELRADSEEDLALLSSVNSFVVDDDANHVRIVTTGTHDKTFMRRMAKGFPKKLLGLPWKIDYRIRVPVVTDIEIDAGRGPITLKSIEGAISLTALESDVTLNLAGGLVKAVVGGGTINIALSARNWRGAGADIQLATGELNVELPAGYSGDINASILRTGRIENEYATLEPRERDPFTPRSIKGRAGAGGPTLSFTVGDGTLRIKKAPANE